MSDKKHEPTWPKIACTRCGADIWIEMLLVGLSYMQEREVDCISCEKCGAEWDKSGEPQATTWLAELEGTDT